MSAMITSPGLSPRTGKLAVIGANSHLGRRIVLALGSDAVPIARSSLPKEFSAATVVVPDYISIPAKALEGCIALINCVGTASGNLEALVKVNVDVGVAAMHTAEHHCISRLVHISSFSVYGKVEHIDGSTVEVPVDAYGISKLIADRALLSCDTVDVAIVRLPAIVGQDIPSKLARLVSVWRKMHFFPVNPNAERSMISIDAAAAAAVVLARAEGPVGGKWLVAEPRPVNLYQLASYLPSMRQNRLWALPLPDAVTAVLRRVLPSIFDRIFGSSILIEKANAFCSLGLTARLDDEILRMITMTERPGKSRIFVVSELYYPEDTSTGYFVTHIAEGLSEHYPVSAICSKPTYSERHLDVSFRETHRGVDIKRVRSTRMNKDSMLGRAVNLLTFTLGAAWSFALSVRRGDLVICLTNPPPLPLLIGLIARFRGARSVMLVHDLYPEVLVATGHLTSDSLAYRLLYKVFATTYRLYDRIVVLGRDMQELVRRKIDGKGADPVIIPNWGDVDDIRPLQRPANPFAIAHGLEDQTVIQFSGNLGRTHDLETVVAVAETLKDEPDIVFLFAGYGGKARLIDNSAGGSRPSNILFVPRQPREMLGPMLACADATVIAFVDEMMGVSVPSRMYNIMAAGVPIIAMCDRRSELARTVEELDSGWVLGTGDEIGLTELVRKIHRARTTGSTEAALKGSNGRRGAEMQFNRRNVTAEFQNLIKSL